MPRSLAERVVERIRRQRKQTIRLSDLIETGDGTLTASEDTAFDEAVAAAHDRNVARRRTAF